MKKTVILGVTGGIAAYKSVDLIQLLRNEEINVHVIATENATKIISTAALEKASGNKVHHELFADGFDYKTILTDRKVDHIALADSADVVVVAPATANILAQIANGFASDFLTTTLLAVTKPIIICPSMNVNMWNNPVVKENLEKIKRLGYIIVKPTSGTLACGYEGEGKLEDISKIKDEVLHQLHRSTQLKGQKFIVTAGGTKERIDDVRFITNHSSGKMGTAIAEELFLRGADVLLIRAKNAVKPRYVIKEQTFETSAELEDLIKKYVNEYDVIFHAAAVSDFQVVEPYAGKISSNDEYILKMKPQAKIIDQIKVWNPNIKLIAFKATSRKSDEEIIEIAKQKLQETSAEAIVANDASAAGTDSNEIYIIKKDGSSKKFIRGAKQEIASNIITHLHTPNLK